MTITVRAGSYEVRIAEIPLDYPFFNILPRECEAQPAASGAADRKAAGAIDLDRALEAVFLVLRILIGRPDAVFPELFRQPTGDGVFALVQLFDGDEAALGENFDGGIGE